MTYREAADVGLVDDCPFPRDLRPALLAPGKRRIDHSAFRHEGTAIALIKRKVAVLRPDGVAEQGIVPLQVSDDLFCVGIEQKLVVVEAMTFRGTIWAVDAVAVDLARTRIRQIAVPYLVRVFRKFDALDLLLALQIEQAEFHLGGIGREQGEVDAEPI